jgi:hypothetical protein
LKNTREFSDTFPLFLSESFSAFLPEMILGDQGGKSGKVIVGVYCFGAHCSGWQHSLMALSLISAPDITSFTPQAICPFPY